MMEDDEDVLISYDDNESEFFKVVKLVISEVVVKDLQIP